MRQLAEFVDGARALRRVELQPLRRAPEHPGVERLDRAQGVGIRAIADEVEEAGGEPPRPSGDAERTSAILCGGVEDGGGCDRAGAAAWPVLVVVGAVEEMAVVDEGGGAAAVEVDRLAGPEPDE